MKSIKILKLLAIVTCVFAFSCGSTEKVISSDGKVYELKGNKFFNNGEDVTEVLTNEEKTELKEVLEQRLAVEEAAAKKQEALEKAQAKAEKAKKKAEKEQKRLEKRIKEKENARKDFFKAKDKLQSRQEKYAKLLDKGKLSPNDIEKWEKTIKGLEKDVQDAENKLKRF